MTLCSIFQSFFVVFSLVIAEELPHLPCLGVYTQLDSLSVFIIIIPLAAAAAKFLFRVSPDFCKNRLDTKQGHVGRLRNICRRYAAAQLQEMCISIYCVAPIREREREKKAN